jgi:hypothetical protein
MAARLFIFHLFFFGVFLSLFSRLPCMKCKPAAPLLIVLHSAFSVASTDPDLPEEEV